MEMEMEMDLDMETIDTILTHLDKYNTYIHDTYHSSVFLLFKLKQ